MCGKPRPTSRRLAMSRIVGTAMLVVAIAGCHEATPPTSPRLSALDVGSPPVPYEVIDLGNVSGMTGAWAVAMNDRGQIVGFSSNQRGVTHPFLWQDGVMTNLDPDRRMNNPSAVPRMNDAGQVVWTRESFINPHLSIPH